MFFFFSQYYSFFINSKSVFIKYLLIGILSFFYKNKSYNVDFVLFILFVIVLHILKLFKVYVNEKIDHLNN